MQDRPKHMAVESFDFDGCLFNINYIENNDEKNRLIKYNETLLTRLCQKAQSDQADEIVLFVGSNA